MSRILRSVSFTVLFLFCLISGANEPVGIPWKNGQILGISNRAGLTPVLVQLSTLSMIDHVGMVFIENEETWIYEYTNANGFQKSKIHDAWNRAKDLKGDVHYLLAELVPALSDQETAIMKSRFESWMDRTSDKALMPINCHDSIQKVTQGIRNVPPIFNPLQNSIPKLLEGFILDTIKRNYGEGETWPVMATIFNHMKTVSGNLPQPALWESNRAFLNSWKQNGDFTKLSRVIALRERVKLSNSLPIENYRTNTVKFLTKEIITNASTCHQLLENGKTHE